MSKTIDRRSFLAASAVGSLASHALAEQSSARESIVLGVMGVNGRGRTLARGFAELKNC